MVKKEIILVFLLGVSISGSCKNISHDTTDATKENSPVHPQTDTTKVSYPIIFQLPNDQWHLAVNKQPSEYIFKRNAITDSSGNHIIPSTAIYAEDAATYGSDITMFTSQKMQPFTDAGVKNELFLNWQHKDYPLTMKNALFLKGTYNSEGLDHIIYMIYIMDKKNRAIQVYMDMTKELEPTYGKEFWTTIKSLKELK